MKKLFVKFYYFVKPTIPRIFQIWIRSFFAQKKRKASRHIWPIDPNAARPPDNWPGWPDNKIFAFVITHDVDTSRGLEKIFNLVDLEESFGLRSSFNFVPLRYKTPDFLIKFLVDKGFEIGVHGLYHDGKLYRSKLEFKSRALEINKYLKRWNAAGFRSPAMHSNLEWLFDLNISYDSSTFDTDPFEPYPIGVRTIFPFPIISKNKQFSYIELPYTLPQDFTVFILLKEKNISIWKQKVDWIAKHGGMVLLNVHPDYISFQDNKLLYDEYSFKHYYDFLYFITTKYRNKFWHAKPLEVTKYLNSFL